MKTSDLLLAGSLCTMLVSCTGQRAEFLPSGSLTNSQPELVCAEPTDIECFSTLPAKLSPQTSGQYILQRDLSFIDANGRNWRAPATTITDGASIPALFVPFFGDRMSARWREAAVVHDAYCATENADLPQYQSADWETVHQMFFDAVITLGTPRRKALLMYAAIFLGGPRWDDPKRSLEGVEDDKLRSILERCSDWIEKNDPNRAELREWMLEREQELLTR